MQAARAGRAGPHHAHPRRAVLPVQALVLRPARGERHLGGTGGVAPSPSLLCRGTAGGGRDWSAASLAVGSEGGFGDMAEAI